MKLRDNSAAHIAGRVITVEAILLVLLEDWLDRPSVDDEKREKLINHVRESGKKLAAQLGHDLVKQHALLHLDEMLKVLIANLPAMKGEFGQPK